MVRTPIQREKGFLGFLRRFTGSTRGQGLVEFALMIPIVLFLFFGVYEFGRFYFSRLTLQHAVAEAARFAVTGESLDDEEGNSMTRAQSIVSVIKRNAQNLNLDVDRITIDPADAGGPGDVVTVSAEFTFNFFLPGYSSLFPDGDLEFEVTTAMKNEPFIPGQGQP